MEMKINSEGYITNPINSIGSESTDEKSYIKVGSHYFYFTTPGICTMYNKALQIFKESEDSKTIIELRQTLREKIRDKYVRAWALYCIKDLNLGSSFGSYREDVVNQFI